MIYLLLLLSLNVFSGITTNIVHLENTENGKTLEAFVTYKGRVFAVDASNTDLIQKLNHAKENNLKIEIRVEEEKGENELEKILEVHILEDGLKRMSEENLHPMINYTPSNVESYEKALEIFKTLNRRTKMFSQCFNRAHIWAKQMYDDYQVDSMKILIYYTKKYRREVNKKWWFHIAPMISVNGEYYVMDREFTRKPITDEEWEKIFIRKMEDKSYRCKRIQNIKEYYADNGGNNEFCHIQHTSMYYWEPNDMSRLDKTGEQKTSWKNRELRIAAKEAFKKWKKVYKKYKEPTEER